MKCETCGGELYLHHLQFFCEKCGKKQGGEKK